MAPTAPTVTAGGNGHHGSDGPSRAALLAPPAHRRAGRPRVVRPRRRWARPDLASAGWMPERRSPVILAALGFVLLLALLVRVAAARQISPQIDEPATILAAHQIAERGLPILPSGTLYLHGATLSYALLPFVWLDAADLDDLTTLRLISVVAGVGAVGLTYLLARRLTGAAWVAILAAFLLAIDAVSVQWSAHVRMYALLQALTLAVILLALGLLERPTGGRHVAAFIAVFWLAILTHIGAAIIWPALALVALLAHGRALFGPRRDLLAALAGALAAPLTVTILSRVAQPADFRPVTDRSLFSFAGEGLFNDERFRAPVPVAWQESFGRGYANDFLPYAVVVLTALLAGRYLLDPPRRPADHRRRLAVGTLLAISVTAILAVSLFTLDQEPRYLLNVHPLDYVFLAVGLELVISRLRLPRPGLLLAQWRRWLPLAAASAGGLALMLGVVADGLAVQFRTPLVDPNQIAATQLVAAARRPDDLVIVALTPAPYLALGGERNLAFLAGDELTRRVARYTRLTADGRTVDYWIGVDAITSTGELCRVLASHPGAWLILDTERMTATWAYAGPMAELIRASTDLVAVWPDGIEIYRRPPSAPADPSACG